VIGCLCLFDNAVDGLARACPSPCRRGAEKASSQAPGTNIAASVCHGAPASLSPSPRAWPAALGAVDMPIDCASTFLRLRKSAAAHGFKALHFNACESTRKNSNGRDEPGHCKAVKYYLRICV
jgi:hypothetical protein